MGSNKDFINRLKEILDINDIEIDVPMVKYTSFKVGGPVDYLVNPGSYQQVSSIVKLCRELNMPYYIIGNCSNLIVKDGGFRGTLIKLSKLDKIYIEGNRITSQSGTLLKSVSNAALGESLTGFEFASGIPGSVGGAIYMLNSYMGSSEKVAYYIRFAKDNGIDCLPPDINESRGKFTVEGKTIRFGMAAVKNVGEGVIDSIVDSRDKQGRFKDLPDFIESIDLTCVNKRAIESLIFSGSLDCFKKKRSQMLAVYEKIMDGVSRDKKRNLKGQVSLFSSIEDNKEISIKYPEVKEFDKRYLLSMEKEMTGLYISGHPLSEYEEILKKSSITKISDIIDVSSEEEEEFRESNVEDQQKVTVGGIISSLSKKVTRKNDMGQEQICRLEIY